MLRMLDPVADTNLLQQTFEWLQTAPQWRRDTVAVFGHDNLSTWLYNAQGPARCDIGVWVDKEFVADIILTARGPGIVEVHFEAKARTDPQHLLTAFEIVRDRAWEQGLIEAYTWTPTFNRLIIAMDKAIGFVDQGVRMFKGQTHGKAVQWVKLTIRNSQVEVTA